ncbi:MAG: ABC transporter permease [Parasporobacterium sp.]|nr:ABC transporter permease [Parasporobacterium sp.]
MFADLFNPETLQEAWEIICTEFPLALWETFYVTVLATAFAIIIGLPLGILVVVGEKGGVLPIPRWILSVVNFIINVMRSIPFLILMILVFPLTRALIGTTIGTVASIVPLVIAAFPFVARLVEGCLREVNPNIIEMAQSTGASPLQIICKVMLPESVPSLISNFTVAITTILGYSAMSGIIGGGGLGKIAINYGYYRYKYLVMFLAVIVLVILVQVFQTVGTRLAVNTDKRLKNQAGRRHRDQAE